MSSIDKRVVEMEFDNKQFEAGIKDTLASLDALKKGLTLEGAAKGLSDVENAAKNTNLGGMADAVENISSKFSALGAIAFTIIQNLTNKVMDFVGRTANLVWDPLIAGGRRRALNIEQAKFQFRGLGVDVEAAMADALYAVQGTAFGLDEAAKAASQLSASQVDLGDDMKGALRGISGVAAMTNSSYEDTARIFTRVAGQGRVMAVDLNSIASRGLNAAAVLADAMGVTEAEIRDMVSAGEISFDIFSKAMDEAFGENATKANETYTGSLANLRAALSRIGAGFFTPWLLQQRDLFNAITPAIDGVGAALKPVIGMFTAFTGRKTIELINRINDFNFDRLSMVIAPLASIIRNVVRSIVSVLNPIRDAFRQIFPPSSLEQINDILRAVQRFTAGLKMGADSAENLRRTFAGVFAIFSIGWTIFKAVAVFLADIFGMVFSGSGAFLDATANIGDFLVALDQAVKNGTGLTTFFENLTNVLRGPIAFIKELAAALVSIFDFDAASVNNVSSALEPLGRIGEIVFDIWNRVLASFRRVWDVLEPIASWIGSLFGDLGSNLLEIMFDLDFDQVIDTINTGLFGGLLLIIRRFVENMGQQIGGFAHRFTQPFNQMTITLRVMQSTLRAMTLLQIAIAIGILAASAVALSKVDAAGLTRALSAMTAMMIQLVAALQMFSLIGGASGILRIGGSLILLGIALRILTSSVKALAELEWEELAKGLTGLTVLLAGLVLAAKSLPTMFTGGMVKTGAALILLAVGIRILVRAVTDLSGLSWEAMARGLVGVGALLGSLAIFTRLAAVNKGGLLQGAGLLLLAAGIRLLASAVVIFAALSWEEIARGLTAVAGILASFAIFTQAVNPAGIVRTGISLIFVGAAMKILASAMRDFSSMSWDEVGRGLLTMGVALGGVALALGAIPPNAMGSAASIVAVSVGLVLIAKAMKEIGTMGWDQIAGAVMGLGAMLGMIAIAVNAMTTATAGAAAIFIVAAALRVLAPVLVTFGNMSLMEMAKSIGMLAAVFVVLGVAGMLLAPIVPVLLGLGAALLLLGGSLLLAGAGVLLFSAGLTALAAAGAAGTAAIIGIITGLIGLLPIIAQQLGLALVVFIEIIASSGPAILNAMSAIIQAVTKAISDNIPDIIELFGDLALQMVEKLRDIIPPMAAAALEMILGVLQAINKNAPKIIRELVTLLNTLMREMGNAVPRMAREATNLMVAFLQSIAKNMNRVIRAGTDVIIAFIEGIGKNAVRLANAAMAALRDFLNGLATAIDRRAGELRSAGRNIARAMIDGMTGGLFSGAGKVATAARDAARSALDSAKNFLGIRSPSKEFEKLGIFSSEGLAGGMEKAIPYIEAAATHVGKDAMDAMRDSMSGLSDLISMDPNMNPTITPVLDLSTFRKDAEEIGSTFRPGAPMTVDLAYSKASEASHGYHTNRQARNITATDGEITPAEFTYNQYNTSPKALSAADIYRQTRNQLSATKGL